MPLPLLWRSGRTHRRQQPNISQISAVRLDQSTPMLNDRLRDLQELRPEGSVLYLYIACHCGGNLRFANTGSISTFTSNLYLLRLLNTRNFGQTLLFTPRSPLTGRLEGWLQEMRDGSGKKSLADALANRHVQAAKRASSQA